MNNANIPIFGTLTPAGSTPLLSIEVLERLAGKGISVNKETGSIESDMTNIIHIGDTEPLDKDTEIWLTPGTDEFNFSGLNIIDKVNNLENSVYSLSEKVNDIENIFKAGINAGTPSDTFEGYFSTQKAVKPSYSSDDIDASINVIEIMEGNYDNVTEVKPVNTAELFSANTSTICIKHGSKNDLSKMIPRNGALYYAADTNKMYIGYNNKWRILSMSSDDDNITPEPDSSTGDENNDFMKPIEKITFIAEPEEGQSEGKEYVMTLNSKGNIIIRDKTIIDAKPQELDPNKMTGIYLQGLYFTNIYAGGYEINNTSQKIGKNNSPCSHNFIEIYNNTTYPINLSGTSIQYSEGGSSASDWQVYPLSGIVPPSHSYLIRGAKLSDTPLIYIDNYDIDFPNLFMSDIKFKLYLACKTTPCQVANPSNPQVTSDNYDTTVFGDNAYIDFFSCINGKQGISIDAVEKNPYDKLNNVSCMVRTYTADYVQGFKKIKTFNTKKDFEEIRYNIDFELKPQVDIYKPWGISNGIKTLFYNKTHIPTNMPGAISLSYGLKSTTRCFNWISEGYNNEYLYIRQISDNKENKLNSKWEKYESINAMGDINIENNYLDPLYKRILINAVDGTTYTAHKQILRNLNYGKYEYYCGHKDAYSDIYTFEVKNVSHTDPFDFVQITDQQGWSRIEYIPHKMAFNFIDETENNKNSSYPATGNTFLDFYINTGDVSQNGNRPGEWLSYFEDAQSIFATNCCMTVVGNNDLCPTPGQLTGKNYPLSFEYYNTYEHNPENIPWVDIDDMSKGVMKSVYSFDYGCVHFISLNSNNYINEQIPWFEKDIELAKKQEIPPKYYIVLVHDGPFNIISKKGITSEVRNNRINESENASLNKRYLWSRAFERNEIDLVMCGHKHTYSFSHLVKEKTSRVKIDPNTGNQLSDSAPEGTYVYEDVVLGNDAINPYVIKLQDLYTDRENIISNNDNFKNYVLYTMSQATGYKLSSNVDVPATDISWLASYYPGVNNDTAANPEQFYPSYIRYNVLSNNEGIEIIPYKLTNIMDQGAQTFSPYINRTEPIGRVANFQCNGIPTSSYTLLPKR